MLAALAYVLLLEAATPALWRSTINPQLRE
jgi:hypothetical protein